MIWTLFYYNSLPDVPKGCSLFSEDIMYRDFFKCNPSNTGHYQYPKFETLSYDQGCHWREVKTLLDMEDPDKYVVFYTRHTDLINHRKNKVIGYFKVGKTFRKDGKEGFFSMESVLLQKDHCIEIPFKSRGVPVSWGKSSIKPKVNRILKQLISERKQDSSKKYKEYTLEVMNRLKTSKGRNTIISLCEDCNVKTQCYWGKYRMETKINRLNDLYGKTERC